MTEASAAKTEPKGSSSIAATPAMEDKEDISSVQELEGTSKPRKWLCASLLFLLTLGGIVYFFFGSPESSDLPLSTSSGLEEGTLNIQVNDDGKDDENRIVFLPSVKINIDSANDEVGFERSDVASPADSRSSLSNFNYGTRTFLTSNIAIQQDRRLQSKPGDLAYYLQMQVDGNLVVYDDRFHVYWASGIVQTPSAKRYWTVLQDDGNLVTYSRIGNGPTVVEWASNSVSTPDNYHLVLTPDSNGLMIVRRSNGQVIWSTVTVQAAGNFPPANNGGGVTYTPGKLTRRENGLLLSEGLRSRLVARTGQKLILDGRGGQKSSAKFHKKPDGAAVFRDPDTGGWIYVSNSEAFESDYGRGKGGVGAIYFDKHGRTTDYRMLHTGSTANCGGGKTPWNTWVTCEETKNGQALQVDPSGRRGTQAITMDQGWFESFAYDIRDRNNPRFFVTEDNEKGALRRFTPAIKNWDDPWQLLHAPGTIHYLVLEPRGGGGTTGTYHWTTDKDQAAKSAKKIYPFSEGMDVYKNQLFFVTKRRQELFVLNLDGNTYEKHSTRLGMFDGEPDQVKRLVGSGLLYFCEENGYANGVHARDQNGWFFTVLEANTFNDETTGLAFSPDAKRMYVSFQHTGQIFDIWREDGLPFDGKTLDVRYH